MKLIVKSAIGAAAIAAGMICGVTAGYAYGDAPWCAVINLGMGEVYWDCQYRTFEACVPNVIAGNRGFCNVNPYGPGPNAAVQPVRHPPRRHKPAAHG